ncbi:uncharacterized protein EV420DRAFT_1050640 [Desarmillaria tabescens]|uniref:Uncharacterized protein n=1 Tax=Armillaria tabescens TaxID=1929756 RepID=A0AA39NF94_ARMTA|nr:uncharacterized protein EV420DRAFT_1050640 [Desarmillaria tabescens]KAK0464566.1 hypothetical protein EV420DRAFT_1050640 [Desarmillaria tabescens]
MVVPPSILLVCTIASIIQNHGNASDLHNEIAHTPWLTISVSFATAIALWYTMLIMCPLIMTPREKDGSEDTRSLHRRTVKLFFESGSLLCQLGPLCRVRRSRRVDALLPRASGRGYRNMIRSPSPRYFILTEFWL